MPVYFNSIINYLSVISLYLRGHRLIHSGLTHRNQLSFKFFYKAKQDCCHQRKKYFCPKVAELSWIFCLGYLD